MNGAPITSVTCSAPAKAVDCDERGGPNGICIAKPQITLTPGPTASPNFINPFGASCNQVFCGFGQPNPFGRTTINNGAITIDPNPTQRVFAQINCNADRTWNYVDPNGNLIPITEVSCVPV
uniref:Uncharacterized protein n=1 Tax=Panagrolaimus davidi TaxID=227884 RepID=A0A914P470_9BILA